MIPPAAAPELGTLEMLHDGALVAGMRAAIRFVYTAGSRGLEAGARVRVGLPNTGWERPVPPQQRYWDELVRGEERRLAPFHPVNTTAVDPSAEPARDIVLEVMERMLAPDEDPALAYWRWWITGTLEGADLISGDVVRIRMATSASEAAARVQTFTEPGINVSRFVDPGGRGRIPGPPRHADLLRRHRPALPRERTWLCPRPLPDRRSAQISITDECQCIPPGAFASCGARRRRPAHFVPARIAEGGARPAAELAHARVIEPASGSMWGRPNPSVPGCVPTACTSSGAIFTPRASTTSMHSQKMDFRQDGLVEGHILRNRSTSATLYAPRRRLLDFIAITDQGACLTDEWEFCQGKVREYHEPAASSPSKAMRPARPWDTAT